MDVVLNLLFTSPIGLLSLFTIVFIIGMAFFLTRWVRRNMNNPVECTRPDQEPDIMQRMIHILWPSFLVAGVADIVFTALFDPLEIMYRGEALIEQRIGAYTVGFFVFWMLGIASSALTCYFQRGADEINRCPLPPRNRPEGCPKRGDGDACC